MLREHRFNVGRPDNLVFVNQFLDILQVRLCSRMTLTFEAKMDGLQCLFCGKTFRDQHAFRSHMRKKRHYKINPKDTLYDRFYIVNYVVCCLLNLFRLDCRAMGLLRGYRMRLRTRQRESTTALCHSVPQDRLLG